MLDRPTEVSAAAGSFPPAPPLAAPAGSGQPLPRSVRSYFEPRFGHGLGHVRVHNDAEAADLAASFHARAYTVGRDIVLGAGSYTPETDSGKHVLAHELTHVLHPPPGRDVVSRIPMNPQGTPFQAEVFPAWSTPLRERPAHGAARLVDLPRGHVVTVEGGKAWVRVSTVVDGKPLAGFISHEQLRRLPGKKTEGPKQPEAEKPKVTPLSDLPPLRGVFTEASQFFVRATPGKDGAILGKLSFEPIEVTVLEAREVKDKGPPSADLWYRVAFTEKDFQTVVMSYSLSLVTKNLARDAGVSPETEAHDRALQAHTGTDGWVGQAALGVIAMPWDLFLRLLADFDKAHASRSGSPGCARSAKSPMSPATLRSAPVPVWRTRSIAASARRTRRNGGSSSRPSRSSSPMESSWMFTTSSLAWSR
jgi:hypothetical protein